MSTEAMDVSAVPMESRPDRDERAQEPIGEEAASAAGSSEVKVGDDDQAKLDELLCWLCRHPLDQIPRNTSGEVYVWKIGDVVVVRHDESIPSVLRKLATESFLSAPVMRNNRFVGIVDMNDMVRYTTDLFTGETEEKWTDFFDKRTDFASTKVEDVMKTSAWEKGGGMDPFAPVLYDSSLMLAWETMARGGVHRVPLLSKNEDLMGIMTQSMCISMLRQNIHRLGPIRQMLISEMHKDLKSTVLSVTEDDRALSAFQLMTDRKVSGLAVTDKEGVLVGSISVRDLRGVGPSGEHFSRLFHSVKEFKEKVRSDFPRQAPRTHYSNRLVPVTALYVTPNQTFEHLISMFNDGNLHRIFVVSQESAEKGKPVALHVISQQDVMMQILIKLGMPYPASM